MYTAAAACCAGSPASLHAGCCDRIARRALRSTLRLEGVPRQWVDGMEDSAGIRFHSPAEQAASVPLCARSSVCWCIILLGTCLAHRKGGTAAADKSLVFDLFILLSEPLHAMLLAQPHTLSVANADVQQTTRHHSGSFVSRCSGLLRRVACAAQEFVT